MNGTPRKLRDGTWGAMVQQESGGRRDVSRLNDVYRGRLVTIRTAAGKSWTAIIARVLWTDGSKMLCATRRDESDPRPRSDGRCMAIGCWNDAVDRGYCRRCAFDEFDDF